MDGFFDNGGDLLLFPDDLLDKAVDKDLLTVDVLFGADLALVLGADDDRVPAPWLDAHHGTFLVSGTPDLSGLEELISFLLHWSLNVVFYKLFI